MTESTQYRIRPLILLVDDDVDTLDALSGFLESRDFDVVIAADGRAALELARTEQPDVVLLDMQLPGATGVEVARMLKEDVNTVNSAIIAFTANSDRYLMEEVIRAGCESYLAKPATPDVIESEIWRVLAR